MLDKQFLQKYEIDLMQRLLDAFTKQLKGTSNTYTYTHTHTYTHTIYYTGTSQDKKRFEDFDCLKT